GSDPDDDAGTLRIEATLEPAAPRVGSHQLALAIHDADGAPVEGAEVVVEPYMPAHGHGSTETPVVTELGGGSYEAAPLVFTMPGRWTVTVEATAGGQRGERVFEW